MGQMTRRYPVGIQTFERIIREGYLYVDKTDLVWQLARCAPFVFMSRPRRFGKSLLTSTLDSYFRGDKELFKGLKIESLETEWKKYPVIHLDLSTAKGQDSAEQLKDTDMAVSMTDIIYVFEFKAGGSATEALRQIDDKGYALPYKADGKKVVKVGVNFNKETRTIDSWVIG